MRGRFKVPRHLDLLNRKLVDVAAGRIPRLLVTMPPRHGKSMLTSHFFPAWYVGTKPDNRVLLAGYQAHFAARWGRRARGVMDGVGRELFDVAIDRKSSAADRWEIEGRMGGMETAGVGGALTGKGADLLIVDDPISNSEAADSETQRENLWEWWTSTAYTRLEPNASAVVIQTRWHEDDLAGRLLEEMEKGGEKWEVVNLPAIAEHGDALGRIPGESLWPERYDVAALTVKQRAVGSRVWSSLFQQSPTPGDGAVFSRKFFKYFTQDGNKLITKHDGVFNLRACEVFGTVDLAISEEEEADWTVIQVWAVTEKGKSFLLFQVRERMGSGKRITDAIRAVYRRFKCDWVGVESVGFQSDIVRLVRQEGLSVRKFNPKNKSKKQRAMGGAVRIEQGDVYFPDELWMPAFERELLAFDKGKNDDQVDALSYALNWVNAKYHGQAEAAA